MADGNAILELQAELAERNRRTALYRALLVFYHAAPVQADVLAAARQRADVGEYDVARYGVQASRLRADPGRAARASADREAAAAQLKADRARLRQLEDEAGAAHADALIALGTIDEIKTKKRAEATSAEGSGEPAE